MHSVVLLHFLLVIFYYMFLFFIHNDANWDSEASFKFMFISELIAMVELLLSYLAFLFA